MLDKYSYETFHRTERCPVNHHGTMFLIIISGIFEFETFGQIVIDLNSSQLPTATDGISYHKVEFRTVKSSFAIFYLGFETFLFTSLDDSLLGFFPVFFASDVLFPIHFVAQ